MKPNWIAIDWGTTNLRGWAMGPAGILTEASSDKGMASLKPAEFEAALLDMIGPWLAGHTGAPIPVYACGMVGARQGWIEAPYRAVPSAPVTAGEVMAVPVHDPRITVQITAGLKQDKPADVMRGEETQIAGALALFPNFDGAICLPGTHSKWAQVSAGEVVSFQTFMTGEMFALLSTQSVLRLGMGGDGWDEAAFDTGVAEGMARPERLAASLFRLRAEGLLAGLHGDGARAPVWPADWGRTGRCPRLLAGDGCCADWIIQNHAAVCPRAGGPRGCAARAACHRLHPCRPNPRGWPFGKG